MISDFKAVSKSDFLYENKTFDHLQFLAKRDQIRSFNAVTKNKGQGFRHIVNLVGPFYRSNSFNRLQRVVQKVEGRFGFANMRFRTAS